jgi:hypothetical protein
MKDFINKKPVQIVFLILSLTVAAYATRDFIGMAKRATIRSVVSKLGEANDQLNKSSPGFERMEVFVHKLKAIDTSATPVDFRFAFSNYVASLDNGLNEFKSTSNTISSFDGQISENKEILVRLTKKYLSKYP